MNTNIEIVPKYAVNPANFRQNLIDNTFTNLYREELSSLKNLRSTIVSEYNTCHQKIPKFLFSGISTDSYEIFLQNIIRLWNI